MAEGDNSRPTDSQVLKGGAIPGLPGQAAYSLTRREPSPIPILIAVPHAGRAYPPHLLERMRSPSAATLKLEDRYVDLLAIRVAQETGASLLVAHAPRAMIDLNRAVEEMDWDMLRMGVPYGKLSRGVSRRARSGLGLIPRRLPGLGEIWKQRLERSELQARIEDIHQPYHRALAQCLRQLRSRWGAALLIDMHSMPPLVRRAPSEPALHFVIGDRFGGTCDGSLCAAAFDEFARQNIRAAHNRPYAGGYVLDRHAAPSLGIHAMQIEICRSLYLDDELNETAPGAGDVAALIIGIVRRLAAEVAALGRGNQLPQAAE